MEHVLRLTASTDNPHTVGECAARQGVTDDTDSICLCSTVVTITGPCGRVADAEILHLLGRVRTYLEDDAVLREMGLE